ncbi:hypothetical protein ACFLV5_02915 [Chloroflexota bacterium]
MEVRRLIKGAIGFWPCLVTGWLEKIITEVKVLPMWGYARKISPEIVVSTDFRMYL